MTVELDHLFTLTSRGAPEVERLVAFGLSEGQPNTHPGQGTACRRFFFHNAYLEFVWVEDEQEAASAWAEPLGFVARSQYRQTGASPFGLILRPAADAAEDGELPFATWTLRPPYLPEPLTLEVADSAAVTDEPLLFYMSFGRRADRSPVERRQPLAHAAGFNEITGIRLSWPGTRRLSPALQTVEEMGVAHFSAAPMPLAEVSFDGERQGKSWDFRPALPLRFHW